ncbi:MAG: hypothetical protein WCG28_04005 [bacterium]
MRALASTNRDNALGRGESSPQPEMGTAHLLVFEPFPYLELALVALAEIPEADAEGVFSLDWTPNNMMNEGTEHLYSGSCRIPNLAEFKKNICRGFAKSSSPRNALAKPRPFLDFDFLLDFC